VKARGSLNPDRPTGGLNCPGSNWGLTAPPTLPGIELKFGRLRLRVRSDETFVFYAAYIAGEYQFLDIWEGDVVDAGAFPSSSFPKALPGTRSGPPSSTD